ncbi:MAG: C2H2-type zinc finger protein [Clostridiales bacterium]|nr:C2H2-type zinc finger protein [Clostridiales bacterium]
MKKVLAIVLSLVIALSCAGVAFAADTYTCKICGKIFTSTEDYNDHLETHITTAAPATTTAVPDVVVSTFVCPDCGRIYANSKDYNACIAAHRGDPDAGDQLEFYFDKYIVGKSSNGVDNQNVGTVTTITGIIDYMVGIFQDSGVLDIVKDIITRILDYIESKAYGKADVAGAVDELEAKVDTMGLGSTILAKIKQLINSLRQKIKDLYAGERATIAVTEAEAPAETGSSVIGIACFAAVSVAAAAAFVCTRKKN